MRVDEAMEVALSPRQHDDQERGMAAYTLAVEVDRLQRKCQATVFWMNKAYGPNLDDWPEIFWWIYKAAKAKGE